MPLKAVVGDCPVVGYLQTKDEWAALRSRLQSGEAVAVLNCGHSAYARTSRRGLHHFVHQRGAECAVTAPESWQHLEAKRVIIDSAREVGWVAEPEVAGDGWVADVLATRDAVCVCFEVQWSRQDEQGYQRRQEIRRLSGVRTAWFSRYLVTSPFATNGAVPSFGLRYEDGFRVAIGLREIPLGEAVRALLTRRCQFREALTANVGDLGLEFYRHKCDQCSLRMTVWSVGGQLRARCGAGFQVESEMWMSGRLEAEQAVLRAVRRSGHPHLATIRRRYSATAALNYDGFGCPRCARLAGDYFVERTKRHTHPFDVISVRLVRPFEQQGPHWCYVATGICCDPQTVH